MFGLRPKYPISDEARWFVDETFTAFITAFGQDAFRAYPLILPTDANFPETWDGTDTVAEAYARRVATYMKVDMNNVNLFFLVDENEELPSLFPEWSQQSSGAAGHYRADGEAKRHVVAIKLDQDPIAFIATMAHELAHVWLLGDGHHDHDTPNLEP